MTATTGRENRFQQTGRPGGGPAPAPEPAAAPPAAKAKKSKKKLIMAVVGVLVLAAVGYKFFAPKPAYVPAAGETVALEAQTLNLAGGHYLKLGVSVQLLKGKATAAAFDTAEASQLLIAEYADRAVEAMDTNDERDKLQADLQTKIKKAYPDEIWKVYVTQFVSQ